MKKFNKKSLVMLACVTVLLTFAVSGTVAFLADNSGPVVNEFTPGTIVPEINETNGTTKKDVFITNTGTVDAYVRAKIVVTWQKKVTENDVTTIQVLPASSSDYTITGTSAKWLPASDGYYYYSKKVAATNGVTENLIGECTGSTRTDGYILHVEVLVQAIQAEPETTVESLWPVEITNGILALAAS